jgi:hypothetical protein
LRTYCIFIGQKRGLGLLRLNRSPQILQCRGIALDYHLRGWRLRQGRLGARKAHGKNQVQGQAFPPDAQEHWFFWPLKMDWFYDPHPSMVKPIS